MRLDTGLNAHIDYTQLHQCLFRFLPQAILLLCLLHFLVKEKKSGIIWPSVHALKLWAKYHPRTYLVNAADTLHRHFNCNQPWNDIFYQIPEPEKYNLRPYIATMPKYSGCGRSSVYLMYWHCAAVMIMLPIKQQISLVRLIRMNRLLKRWVGYIGRAEFTCSDPHGACGYHYFIERI